MIRQTVILPVGFIELVTQIGWDCRISRLHLCKEVRPPSNECPGYDIKPSDCEALFLELKGIHSTHSSPLIPGPL